MCVCIPLSCLVSTEVKWMSRYPKPSFELPHRYWGQTRILCSYCWSHQSSPHFLRFWESLPRVHGPHRAPTGEVARQRKNKSNWAHLQQEIGYLWQLSSVSCNPQVFLSVLDCSHPHLCFSPSNFVIRSWQKSNWAGGQIRRGMAVQASAGAAEVGRFLWVGG